MTSLAKRRWDAAGTAVVALVCRAAVVAWAYPRFPPAGDGQYYDILARRLARGEGYTWAWPDGAVTYAAHYPVGYPALLAAAYRVFGASSLAAMALHAVLGAAAAFAIHRVVDGPGVARWRPIGAGLAVALHPALVAYTPAYMTEGVTGSLLVIAAALAAAARRAESATPWIAATGAAMALATLVRPQSLALAPVLGLFAAPFDARWATRTARAAGVVVVALACVAPWTARNCVRMHRCALVSVNEGWNLLIGATTTTGGWHEVPVPPECATVWDEAGKDVCFDHAARRVIAAAPGDWLARAPSKIAMTFEYIGAAPWYLHTSNAAAFDHRAEVALLALETIMSRLALLGALVACGRLDGRWPRLRKVIALAGAVAALSVYGWLGYVAVALAVALSGWRAVARAALVVPVGAAAIAMTVLIHAAFFGAGRYGLVVAPFVAGLAFATTAASKEML
jgi:4-amino-4-deoxy-L-arabinose transferase-like glycosyltransferase